MREEDSPLAFDVVVVGSGTGLLAAVTAGELDLRALVVEKSEYLGGSTAMSGGGFWIPGNSVLRDLGVPDSRERASAYLDALVGDRAPRERRESFGQLPGIMTVVTCLYPDGYGKC
jgi:ribulose 1,5-bisphosphate synthetase/thiazole synthase